MLILVDKYTKEAAKLRETLQCIGEKEASIVVLQDDGFLPAGICSPYEFFLYRDEKKELAEKALFYNFIDLPEFWEVRLTGWTGGVFDMGREKAKIYFREPVEERNVRRVEWHMEDGWVYKVDYYNKYGLRYASEFLDSDGKVESKVFYSATNQEIIVEQPVNHIISVLDHGMVKRMFDSFEGFVDYYLEEAGFTGERVLFAQEEKTLQLMPLAETILLASDELLNQYRGMGGKNGSRFYALPACYPENHARGEALLLTASDRIEKLEYLVGALPEVAFHIAAHTQVSDKLHQLAELENVHIYPQISAQDLDMLWQKCDFYLDINHYREIYDAVNQADQHNMLILGFEHTVHHRELIADECIFAEEGASMVSAMKEWKDNPETVQDLLERQHRKKIEIWEELLLRRESGHGI